MKTKITQVVIGILLGLTSLKAQVTCVDTNGFVNYKNVGGTGAITLSKGSLEQAAQTYHYTGPGTINAVKIYGNYPAFGGVALGVGIYNVDASGRPTSLIQSRPAIWWFFNNPRGYLVVPFGGGGVAVNHNFAIEVEVLSAFPYGTSFQVQYTGNGEGNGQDLASLAGTSTGWNWTSADKDFSKDGDFYLVPVMSNNITANFASSETCAAIGDIINFTNTSRVSVDSMFNTIAMPWYSGSDHFYAWDFGDGSPVSYAVSPTHSYVAAGAYTVKLTTTLAGWTTTCSAVKTMRISVGSAVSTTAKVNVTCAGGNDGSIKGVGSGGIPPYMYSLDGETFQASATFNSLKMGSYTMYMEDSLGCMSSTSFVISQPLPIIIKSYSTTNASCNASDGGILVTATGGVGTLMYQLNSGTFQASGSFSSLKAGWYTVTVKDANGCTNAIDIPVSNQGGPALSIVSTTNVSCFGGNDGTIVLNATGGSGILKYSIDGGVTFQTSGSFIGIKAGAYDVMVKDATGCTASMQIIIAQPPKLKMTVTSSAVSCNGGNDGSITVLTATGGTGVLTYSINGVGYQSSNVFQFVSAGTYTIYVKDAAGCVGTNLITVTQPTPVTATATPVAATCNGSYTGSIAVTATGGTGGYIYTINNQEWQSSGLFTGLSAGTYTLTVMDGHGCEFATTATVTQPTAVTATITTTTSTCGNSNGGLLASGSGGSGTGYTYSINDTLYNSSGSFINLMAGTYYVIVKDSKGCTSTFPATVTDANGPVIAAASHTNVACNGGNDGTITINSVTGGTGVLKYSVDGTDWQTSNVFNGLSAGIYTVTVKDANGCTGTVIDTLTQPNAFVISTTVNNVLCYGDNSGKATILASGGAGTLAYSIDGGIVFQSSNVFTGVYAGAYSVIVRDAAGCTGTSRFVITQPYPLIPQTDVLNVSCNGDKTGTITLIASGGTRPYSYSIDGVTYVVSNQFTGLGAGSYTGYVKDGNGCIVTLAINVTQPTPLALTSSVGEVSCAGGSNGYVFVTVSGGTSPYSFDWSNNATTLSIFNLNAGSYYIKVTDENGCSDTATYAVTQPSVPLIVNGVVTDATSASSNDGGVSLTVTGGVGSYTFSWSNGVTTQNLAGVGAGSYTVEVTDSNGCVSTMAFTVAIGTGIPSITNAKSVTLYPNPANNMVTIDAQGSSITMVKILDILGQEVYKSAPYRNKLQVNTESMTPGVYFVQVQVNGIIVTRKLNVVK